ncbi:MAG: SRPBCC family protein [Hyphomicrobiaceae bacterium]
MSDRAPNDGYGVLTEPTTLTIQRFLPGPIDRIWAFLTESDLRRKWLASGDMKMEVGAPFTLTWRNNELMENPGSPPPGFSPEHSMESRITELDPPNRITFTWYTSGTVTFELAPRGGRVLLTVIHRGIPSRDVLLKVGPGWHTHLDVLVARASGMEPPPFWDQWRQLQKAYDRRLAA